MERALYTEERTSRNERNKAIGSAFKSLIKKYPDSKLERIFVEIAKDYGLTSASIRHICKQQGLC